MVTKCQNHFISTLAAVNDESMMRFSPQGRGKHSKQISQKLNISNILNNQETLDEEDHALLCRLIQKYQRDFSKNAGDGKS